ncbi:YncE family protein [Nonomuraea indica]|uniref:YncE family protein n=1 Tax=Nonomuraea indica TaxID=1581193 RepID=A0ABW8A1B8_9ACTN
MIAAGGILALAVGLAVVQAPVASAADSTTALGIALATTGLGTYEKGGDVVVAGGKIFVSGRDRIVVATSEGTVTGAITGLSGAVGLAAASDGEHLYAALSGSNQVAEVDTGTLAITRRFDVAYPCPTNLSLSGTQLFVGYGCDGWDGGLFSLDLSAEVPTAVQIRAGLYNPPLVAAAGNTLVMADPNSLPATVYVYDLTGTSATLRGTIDGRTQNLAGPNDLTITSDGSKLIAGFGKSDGSEDQFESWDTTSLTRVRVYDPPGSHPDAVAISPDDAHVAGATASLAAMYDTATAENVYSNQNSMGSIIPGSLVFSGGDVVGVVRQATGSLYLWRMQGVLLPASTMTLTASSPATALEPLTLTGRLTLPAGAPTDARPVVVTRRLPDGTSTTVGDTTTTADGTFTITDIPPLGGDISYTAVWDGTAEIRWSSASAAIRAAKRQTSLTLAGPDKGSIGKTLKFHGALDGGGKLPPAGTLLTVERADSGSPVRLRSAVLADDGSFSFTDTPSIGGRQYTYTVKWPGNDIFLPSQASHVVSVS